jgi:hypothetical protein
LLQLALETGYNHGDFHQANVMISPSSNYFATSEYRPYLIDFGRTTKLNPEAFKEFRTRMQQKQYTRALAWLCDSSHANEYISDRLYWERFYGWVCNMPTSSIVAQKTNREMEKLFEQREAAIDRNIKIMSELHQESPNVYPLLPISNNIKNQIFHGYGLRGGSKKLKKYKKKNLTKSKIKKTKKTYQIRKRTINKKCYKNS